MHLIKCEDVTDSTENTVPHEAGASPGVSYHQLTRTTRKALGDGGRPPHPPPQHPPHPISAPSRRPSTRIPSSLCSFCWQCRFSSVFPDPSTSFKSVFRHHITCSLSSQLGSYIKCQPPIVLFAYAVFSLSI